MRYARGDDDEIARGDRISLMCQIHKALPGGIEHDMKYRMYMRCRRHARGLVVFPQIGNQQPVAVGLPATMDIQKRGGIHG